MTGELKRGRRYLVTEEAGWTRRDHMKWTIYAPPADEAAQWRHDKPKVHEVIVREVGVNRNGGTIYRLAEPATPRQSGWISADKILEAKEVKP